MAEFETVTCSRCFGSGKYSYCQMYGDTCFKCHGKGKVYTERALAALRWIAEQRKVDIGSLKLGDRVNVPGVGKFTVKSIAPGGTGKSLQRDGSWKEYQYLEIRGEKLGYCGIPGQTEVQLIPPQEVRLAQRAQALEMQGVA